MSEFEPPNEHDGDSRTVVWSPDSHYLAYQADYQDLWVMCADGAVIFQLDSDAQQSSPRDWGTARRLENCPAVALPHQRAGIGRR